MFRLENVSYHDILTSISMQFTQGEISCITGESGAGKSTILKFLNNMLLPTAGKIYYKDHLIETYDSIELRREAVMLPQQPVIFEGSIEENLQIGLKFSKKEAASHEVLKKVLEMVSLEKTLGEEAANLSGGEKQRLALARIHLMKPEVYLLDEPTSALDKKTEMDIMERYIKAIKENRGTIVMVTHSEAVADKFADQKIVIPPKLKSR
ncbi:ABC transporter ATP-binding protein [Bacillus sp. AK031]